MSELFQSGQHPDADQLSAFAEDALPAHERQETLAHLAGCTHCRTIVSLSLPPAEVVPEPVATRKPWFHGWNLAWPAAAVVAAMVAFTVHLHKAKPVYAPVQVADAKPPAMPASPPELAPAPKPPSAGAKSQAATTHRAASGSGSVVYDQDVTNLPLQGRNTMALNQQNAPLAAKSVNGALLGAVGAGVAMPLAQRGGAVQPAQGNASGVPLSSASGLASNFNQPQAAVPAAVAAAPMMADVAVAAGSDMNVETANNAASFASLIPQKFHELPSHLAISSTITRDTQTLAVDTAGALFLSTDGGRQWKAVTAQWPGRAVKVELASFPTRARQRFTVENVQSDANSAAGIAGRAAPANSTLTGVITDASGAVIPDASVIVTDSRSTLSRTVKTDWSGHYVVGGLATGDYQIAALAAGFETQRTAITLTAPQQSSVNLTLAIGQQNETVSVQSDAATVSIDNEMEKMKTAKIPAASKALPLFEITTDLGERWSSADGLIWTRN